jgi:hypothetical protein
LRVAHALPGLPKITSAFEKGEISYSKVRALTRIATPETEEILLQIARHGTASHVEKVVRSYRRADPEREIELANKRHEGRYLTTCHDDDGNLVIRGKLPPELGARFTKALDAAVDALAEEDRGEKVVRGQPHGRAGENGAPAETTEACPPVSISPTSIHRDSFEACPPVSTSTARGTFGQRRADALVLLADTALAAKMKGRRAADTHQIVVHVDAEVLADPGADGRCNLEDGSHVSAETCRRLACDAAIVTMLEDSEGNPLSVGRRRRTVPPSIRRALESRQGGCEFPGCHHTRFLEAHHIRHWADGGETSLENTALLCGFHHRQLHEGGFRMTREAGGELTFITKYGWTVERVPPSPKGSPELLERAEREPEIRARDLPVWDGSPIDYGFTVAGLLHLDGKEMSLGRTPSVRASNT